MAEYLHPLRSQKERNDFIRDLERRFPSTGPPESGPFFDAMQSEESTFSYEVTLGKAIMRVECAKIDDETARVTTLTLTAGERSLDVLEYIDLPDDVPVLLSFNEHDRVPAAYIEQEKEPRRFIRVRTIDSAETLIVFLHEAAHEAQSREPLFSNLDGLYNYASGHTREERWQNLRNYLVHEGLEKFMDSWKARLLQKRWRSRLRALRTYIVERDACRQSIEWSRDIEEELGADIGMDTPVPIEETRFPEIFGHARQDVKDTAFSPRRMAALPLRAYCKESRSLHGVLKEFDDNDSIWHVFRELKGF